MRVNGLKALIFLVAASAACSALVRSPLRDIAPANAKLYAGLRDVKDWRNPHLIVDARDVQVLNVGKTKAGELKSFLEKLPKSAWPYGRVVALEEQSIRSGNDDKLIEKNLKKVLAVLKALGIRVEQWPSA
jgi:hypothetical protein